MFLDGSDLDRVKRSKICAAHIQRQWVNQRLLDEHFETGLLEFVMSSCTLSSTLNLKNQTCAQ